MSHTVPMPLTLLLGHGLFAPRDCNQAKDREEASTETFNGRSTTGMWISQSRLHRKEPSKGQPGQTLINTVSSAVVLDQFDLSVLLAIITVARRPESEVKTTMSGAFRKVVFNQGVSVNGQLVKVADSEGVCSLDEAIRVLGKAVKAKASKDPELEVNRELDLILHPHVPRAVANIDIDEVAKVVFGPKVVRNHRHDAAVKNSMHKLASTTVKVMGVLDDDLRDRVVASTKKAMSKEILRKYNNLDFLPMKDVRVLEVEKMMDPYYNAGLIGNGGYNDDGTYRVHFSPALSMHIAIASASKEAWAELNDLAKENVLNSNLWHSMQVNTTDRGAIPIRDQRLLSVYQDISVRLTFTLLHRNYTIDSLLKTIYGEEKWLKWINQSVEKGRKVSLLRVQRMRLKNDLLTLYGMDNLTELVKRRKEFKHLLEKLGIPVPEPEVRAIKRSRNDHV